MNQIKIGKFISKCRKEKNMTQAQLAEKLNITDRAVSKWETGRGMPDSSIMLELCSELGITVNELLSGERLKMEDYQLKFEENLLAVQKEKEECDRRMLKLEMVIGILSTVAFFVLIFTASFAGLYPIARVALIAVGALIFIVGVANAIKIEQVAGYYECRECNYKYVPSYNSVLFAMHTGRTRYMKCPHCGKKSWQKKVISK